MLTRQLSTLIGADLPIDEALAALSEQDDNDRQRALIAALRSRVMEGASLAQAMADFPDSFPEIFRATVAAGEQSSHLARVLDRLADYAEARDALRQTLLSALTYPLLLAVVVAGLLTWVVPQIIGVFENMHQTLPLATRVLMGLSDFLRHWAWLLVGLIVLGVIAIRVALRREAVRYRWHGFLLRLPLIGRLTRAANTARAARTLALLAGAAVPLLDALAIAAQVVPNLPMRESLRQAAFKVREGSGFARALAESKQFPPVALRLIASGEKSGELPRMLEEAAAQQQRDLDRWLGVLSATLGPAVILLVGAMVLFIVLAILLPIFDLNQMVK